VLIIELGINSNQKGGVFDMLEKKVLKLKKLKLIRVPLNGDPK
jgi:hypothetical protein